MIRLNYGQLNQSWQGIQTIGHSRIPAGAFRANVRRIIEQLSADYANYQKEFSALTLEFCTPTENDPELYRRPKEHDRNQIFTERLDELYSVEIEIKGTRLSLSDIHKYCNLSVTEEIILSRWLIESSEEFPSEIDQQQEVVR